MTFQLTRKAAVRKGISLLILFTFATGQLLPTPLASAQLASVLNLPLPGAMVGISPSYVPIAIKGVKIFPENPFRFDFLLDTGHSKFEGEHLNEETRLLIKYFLTALTIPDEDQWVNLSPYEKDRIVPNEFGNTEMGRDLLAQDYLLKQLTASLVYPEQELGKKFWERIHQKAYERYGDADIPVNTFNKVWVMPDHATVYQHGNTAVITESRLKVLLEEDYLALRESEVGSQKSEGKTSDFGPLTSDPNNVNSLGSAIVREIVLPEIEKEVNEGKNFAKLRQIYHSMIMAAWYKRKLKESVFNKIYVGKNKVAGVDVADKEIKQKIYEQYLAAFKKGVYNYIREDLDERTREIVPRKYFSGGVVMNMGGDVARSLAVVDAPSDAALDRAASATVTGDLLDIQAKSEPVDGSGAVLANISTKDDGSGISSERQKALDADADYFMRSFLDDKTSLMSKRMDFYKAGFVRDLRRVTDIHEIGYLAQRINAQWKNAGLDGLIGPFFPALAVNYGEEVGDTPTEVRNNYEWVYKFLEAAEPVERAQALWSLVVLNNAHMRRLGLHPEVNGTEFLDQELLLGRQDTDNALLRRYVDSILALSAEQLAERINGPEGADFTREDLFLWGLLLAVDPTTYAHSLEFKDDQLNAYLRKYFGDQTDLKTAGLRFLQRAFQGDRRNKELERLLIKAFSISEKQWAAKGLRSPYFFGLSYPRLSAMLQTSDGSDAMASTGLKDPFIGYALDLKYFDKEIIKRYLSPYYQDNPGLNAIFSQYPNGRWKEYAETYMLPKMTALFPGLSSVLTGMPADGKAANSTGGALKEDINRGTLRTPGPYRHMPVPDGTVEVWRQRARSDINEATDHEFNGQVIKVKSIVAQVHDGTAEMPDGMVSYRFMDGQTLVVVLSPWLFDASRSVESGFGLDYYALKHEGSEHTWFSKLIDGRSLGGQSISSNEREKLDRDAHILASADDIRYTSSGSLTLLHKALIRASTDEGLAALLDEKDRKYQNDLVEEFMPEFLANYKTYTDMFRKAVQNELIARGRADLSGRSASSLDFEVRVFDLADWSKYRDHDKRQEFFEELRNSVVQRVKNALMSTGETKGALGYEIGRLAGAAVDSVIERFNSFGGDAIRQEAYLREAKITLVYTMEVDSGQYEATLTDTGSGLSYDLLNGLRGVYNRPSEEDKDLLSRERANALKTLEIITGMLGGAMSYNRWDEISIVSKTEGARNPLRFTTGITGVASINDNDASMEIGTAVTINGRSFKWLSERERSASGDNASDVGGIDMDQRALDLKTEGENMKLDVPLDPSQWEKMDFKGFTPVILKINTTNLPVFLGAQNSDTSGQLSSV